MSIMRKDMNRLFLVIDYHLFRPKFGFHFRGKGSIAEIGLLRSFHHLLHLRLCFWLQLTIDLIHRFSPCRQEHRHQDDKKPDSQQPLHSYPPQFSALSFA